MNDIVDHRAPKPPRSTRGRCTRLIKAVALGSAVVALFVLGHWLPVGRAVEALEKTIKGFGPWSPLAFGLIYIVAVLVMVPGSALTVAVGAMFGLVVGTATVSLASTIGAALA
ncbi:MAG: hypothetical protein ABI353_22240, partial [Isosphaeraceae bacterium]